MSNPPTPDESENERFTRIGRQLSWLRKLPLERPNELTRERAANRTRAYLYGNILILAALASLTPHDVESGHGAIRVLGTGISTLIAHLLADIFSHRIRGHVDDGSRPGLRDEIRDALPIASSASFPAFMLAVGWLGWIAPLPVLLASMIVIVFRFLMLGGMVGYLTGERSSWNSVLAGVGLAVAGVAVVGIKLLLTH